MKHILLLIAHCCVGENIYLKGYIIERTLRYGNRAELRWLFARYPEAVIADWVRRWGCFGLPAPHLAFWKLFLRLEDQA